MGIIYPDKSLDNADWVRNNSWNLPPYKSVEFYEYLDTMDIDIHGFKTLPVYKGAVERGEIVDDKWVGKK